MVMRPKAMFYHQTSKQAASAVFQKQPSLLALALLVAASVAWCGLFTSVAADRPLTAAEQDARNAAYRRAGTIVLPSVQAEVNPDGWPEEQQDQVWLTLWDDCDEDGDIVSVSSNGISTRVPLTRQPVRLAVSRPTDGVLRVHGLFDGGGGITVALATAYGPVPLPVMAPGQTVAVPVR